MLHSHGHDTKNTKGIEMGKEVEENGERFSGRGTPKREKARFQGLGERGEGV